MSVRAGLDSRLKDLAKERELDPALKALAEALADCLDAGAGMSTAAVARELRATLAELTAVVADDDDTAGLLAELSAPVLNATQPRKGNARAKGGAGRSDARDEPDAVAAARPRRRTGNRP